MTPQERRDAELCKQTPCNAQMYVQYVELVWGRKMTAAERAELLGYRSEGKVTHSARAGAPE